MLFNTFDFIFGFLPAVLIGALVLGRTCGPTNRAWLGVASLWFYGAWDPRFVCLLLGSIAFNYLSGRSIFRLISSRGRGSARGRLLLISAVAADLLVLCYFKYTNFFLGAIGGALGRDFPVFEILLPLGVSFFTFTQVAFLVDVYRGNVRESDPLDYLLFVTWFPHLIAGPVLHHRQMMPQFSSRTFCRWNSVNVSAGVTIFILGLSKKVLIADVFARYASPIFSIAQQAHPVALFEAWAGALAYTLQLYFDFSGYSDMAIGLSLMFNVRLPLNFDSPYKARCIIDFWRRWHMTLSSFLRDYLYIPLGGSREGRFRRCRNIMITMLLGGLWHGAGWTFVVWGGLHGIYLVINHGWRALRENRGWDRMEQAAGYRLAATALTFLAVVVGWVFFRAESIPAAMSIFVGMAGINGVSLPSSLEQSLLPLIPEMLRSKVVFLGLLPASHAPGSALSLIVYFALALWLVWGAPNVHEIMLRFRPVCEDVEPSNVGDSQSGGFLEWSPSAAYAVIIGVLLFVTLLELAAGTSAEFLYFQF